MILDLLSIVGITLIITRSKIFKPLRELASSTGDFLGELFSCPMCMGVWVGLGFIFMPENAKSALYYPSIGSLASYTIFLILERVKIK